MAALDALAQLLRVTADRGWVESATWIPTPPACPDIDPGSDRLHLLLRRAFAGYDLDLRPALACEAGFPDRWLERRTSMAALYGRMRVDRAALTSVVLRERVAIFDDVLASGKHYHCARQRIGEVTQLSKSSYAVPICGVFLVRRIPRREPGRTAARTAGTGTGAGSV